MISSSLRTKYKQFLKFDTFTILLLSFISETLIVSDSLSLVSTLPKSKINTHNLDTSFFFRSHTTWNLLPFDLRNTTVELSELKSKLEILLWQELLSEYDHSEGDWLFISTDE